VARRPVAELVNRLLAQGPTIKSSELARAAGISRQAAQKHLRGLVKSGRLVTEGKGRVAHYRLAARAPARLSYPCAVLDEERVWLDLRRRIPALAALSAALEPILHYALTEMLNNAIDHSGSAEVEVVVEPTEKSVAFEVVDEGVGLFDNLRTALHLGSNLEALQELSKGKVTTLPDRHTGEGIFFTSKVADYFEADAGGLRWMVDGARGDMAVTAAAARRGTRIRFEVRRHPARTLASVFAEYAKDHAFTKTRMVVKLFASGVRFVSRSEAKRLLHGLERFREVILDFGGVAEVGQGFVDEVFRVWARAHRTTRLTPQRMTPTVAFMIARGTKRAPARRAGRGRRRRPVS